AEIPSQPPGPNNLQSAPVIVVAADGRLQGWLSGSLPGSDYRIELFAGARAGDAEVYLGSLDITTDAAGEATFDVPYTAPAGEPIISATATDPSGNTSELSRLRQATATLPGRTLPPVSGTELIFSADSGDPFVLGDPDAGPLASLPVWDFSLSVTDGTLTLSNIAGLS